MFVIVGHWAKNFPPSAKIFQHVCRDCILCVRKNIDLWRKFFGKKSSFLSFPNIEWIFLTFCQKTYGKVAKTAFYVSIGAFDWSYSFWRNYKISTFFGHWTKLFEAVGTKSLDGFFGTAFSVSIRTLAAEILFIVEKNLFYLFRMLS